MIEIRNVTKSYGDIVSLDNVSAKIGNGSIYGLIGSNGAGKSTLLRVMAGIFRPDGGDVLYDDRSVWENTAVKQEIFYISDDEYKLPGASTDDMMNFYRNIYKSFDKERYDMLCNTFKIERKRSLSTFSKGMKRQVDILLGLSCRPKYLLCDETFDGLDPVMRQFVKKLICEEVAENGMTPIIASHNLRELEDLCDHVGLIHRGGILFESDVDDLKGGILKIQMVAGDNATDISSFAPPKIADFRKTGSVITLIVRGNEAETEEKILSLSPKFYEILPLTLEEVFISEMEEIGYDFTEILDKKR